jgi:hypothetical protein
MLLPIVRVVTPITHCFFAFHARPDPRIIVLALRRNLSAAEAESVLAHLARDLHDVELSFIRSCHAVSRAATPRKSDDEAVAT